MLGSIYNYDPEIKILELRRLTVMKWIHQDLAAPFWRIYHNTAPVARIKTDRRTINLDPDKVYLIPPGLSYSSINDGPMDHLYIHFQAVPPFDENYGGEVYVFPLADINPLFARLEQKFSETPEQIREISLLTRTLALRLLSTVPEKHLGKEYDDRRIRNAVTFIKNNFSKHCTIQALAAHVGMNVNLFIARFRGQVGQSPKQYIIEQRLRKACVMLYNTDASIEEIAETSGFCDRYYFTRIFTRTQHISPAAYRRTFRMK